MSNSAALYPDRLLAHAREPKRRGSLPTPCLSGEASNRLCGDSVRVQLRIVDGRVADYSFEAEACAITVAAASMLGDFAISRSLSELAELGAEFGNWLIDDGNGHVPVSIRESSLDAFAELRHRLSRQRCALLPFEAIHRASSSTGAQR